MDYLSFFKDVGPGIGTLVACLYAIWKGWNKIYDDMINDKKEALAEQKSVYDQIIKDSRIREDRLMIHQDKHSDILNNIAETLKTVNGDIKYIKDNLCMHDRRDSIQ